MKPVLIGSVAALLLGTTLHVPGQAASAPAKPAQTAEQAREAREERAQLRERLTALRRSISAGEAVRSEAADSLAESERSISDANRKLRELDEQQRSVQADLENLGGRQQETRRQLAARQAQLSELLRNQYMTGTQDPFKLLFSGANPNVIQRDLQYLAYLTHAQAQVLESLNANLNELQDMAEQVKKRDAELLRIAAEQQAQRATLLKTQQTRRELLTSISEKLRTQRREAGALERDEKRLSRVVEELARVIERQAREARLREENRRKAELLARQKQEKALQAARAAASRPQASATRPAKSEPVAPPSAATTAPAAREESKVADAGPYINYSGSFAKLKGRMRLPLQGDLTARYGSARQDGGPSWKGVFIRARPGAEIKAVAAGRVVFAEWLRGFGNLLIVDHGDQYLSIYGNNETLFKQPGDAVQGGDTLAAAGNSGGNPETGLYFELRYKGRPFDPLSWVR